MDGSAEAEADVDVVAAVDAAGACRPRRGGVGVSSGRVEMDFTKVESLIVPRLCTYEADLVSIRKNLKILMIIIMIFRQKQIDNETTAYMQGLGTIN